MQGGNAGHCVQRVEKKWGRDRRCPYHHSLCGVPNDFTFFSEGGLRRLSMIPGASFFPIPAPVFTKGIYCCAGIPSHWGGGMAGGFLRR